MGTVSPLDETERLHHDISTLVRMLMALEHINQAELAARTGIHQAVISARMRGVSYWTVTDLHRLAAAFGVDPGVFFRDPKGFTPQVGNVPYSPLVTARRKRSRGQRDRQLGCLYEPAA